MTQRVAEMRSDRQKLLWTAFGVTLLVAFVLLYPNILWEVSRETPLEDPGHIPPAFSGNRVAYGWALFSMFTMTMLSVRKMLSIGVEFRSIHWRDAPDIAFYRAAIFAFCAMVVCGVAPDVILLLLWGEAEVGTIIWWMTADRVSDGIAGAFYLIAVTLIVRAEQLQRQPLNALPETRTPDAFYLVSSRRDRMRDHVRMMIAVAIIALGLALLK